MAWRTHGQDWQVDIVGELLAFMTEAKTRVEASPSINAPSALTNVFSPKNHEQMLSHGSTREPKVQWDHVP